MIAIFRVAFPAENILGIVSTDHLWTIDSTMVDADILGNVLKRALDDQGIARFGGSDRSDRLAVARVKVRAARDGNAPAITIGTPTTILVGRSRPRRSGVVVGTDRSDYHCLLMTTRTMTTVQQKKDTSSAVRDTSEKVIATNRQARFEYSILDSAEAGLALTGTEIKSIRAGKVNVREAYARIEAGEIWLINMHISPYEQASNYFQHDPLRPKKLLLHRREINRLKAELGQKGLTLVPLRIYLKGGRAKVELGLARGKKLYDKRDAMAERDAKRDLQRSLRSRD